MVLYLPLLSCESSVSVKENPDRKKTTKKNKTKKTTNLKNLQMHTNSFGHDDNEGENFDVEKHCETLSGVSINSNERQSQNKNRA